MKPGRSLTELMAAVASERDRASFALLFAHFAPRIRGYMLRLGSDGATAEEFVQEVMLAVWRHAASFDPRRSAVATWVFTIARNRRIDFLRQGKRASLDLDDPTLPAPQPIETESGLDLLQLEHRLSVAIEALPAEQSEVIRLAYSRGMSHSRIAEDLGIPLGTVKSRLRLAVIKLRGILSEES